MVRRLQAAVCEAAAVVSEAAVDWEPAAVFCEAAVVCSRRRRAVCEAVGCLQGGSGGRNVW